MVLDRKGMVVCIGLFVTFLLVFRFGNRRIGGPNLEIGTSAARAWGNWN